MDMKWDPSDLKHKNLAKLTIHGFESDDNFTRYVRCVMKIAVNIREVSLHDRKVCKTCTNTFSQAKVCPWIYPQTNKEKGPSRYPQTSKDKDLLSKKIMETVVASPATIRFRPSCYYPPSVIEYM
jgi:hypothetical protein